MTRILLRVSLSWVGGRRLFRSSLRRLVAVAKMWFEIVVSFPSRVSPEVGLLDHGAALVLVFEEPHYCFPWRVSFF